MGSDPQSHLNEQNFLTFSGLVIDGVRIDAEIRIETKHVKRMMDLLREVTDKKKVAERRLMWLADQLNPRPVEGSDYWQSSLNLQKAVDLMRVAPPGKQRETLYAFIDMETARTVRRCILCRCEAEWDDKDKCWRHKGQPFEEPFKAQIFCDKYGYPIEVEDL